MTEDAKGAPTRAPVSRCRCLEAPSNRPVCTTPDLLHGVCANCYHDEACHRRHKPQQLTLA